MRFSVLFALGLFATSAHAYVPPSEFIVKGVLKKHNVAGVKVRTLVSNMEGDKPGQVRFRDLTVYNSQTHTLRSTALSEDGRELYVSERKGNLGPAASLLFETQLRTTVGALRTAGVPIRTEEELLALENEDARRAAEVSSVARTANSVAWVIGDAKQPSSPQLWVEKDTFLPVRLIFKNGLSGTLDDVRFEKFRFFREFPYPRVITVSEGKTPVLQAEVSDLEIQAVELKTAVTEGFTGAGESAPSAVRELIQRYYESLR